MTDMPSPRPSLNSTSHRSAVGVAWLFAGRLVARLIDLLTLLILVRVLTPADFGKIALAMTLVYIVEAVLELPVSQALVRAPKVEKSHLDTAFTLAVLRGLAVAAIMCAAAWPYALFSHDMSLAPLICVLSLGPALRGLSSPQMIHFARQINFRPDFYIDVAGKIGAMVVATVVALLTHSYWALAAGTVTGPVIMIAASYILAPYRPHLSLSEWRTFDNLVVWNLLHQLVSSINWQSDRILLGRFATHDQLGRYAVANDISSLPNQSLLAPFWRSLIASFATVQDDPERLRNAYRRSINALFLLGAPILSGIALLAHPIVSILLGPQWQDAGTLLSVFSLGHLVVLYALPGAALAVALNRSQLNFLQSVAVMATKVPLIAVGYYWYGVPGVLFGVFASNVMTALVAAINARLMVAEPLTGQFLAPWRPIVGIAAMAAVVSPLGTAVSTLPPGSLPMIFALAAVVGVGALVYITVVFALWHLTGRSPGGEAIIYERLTDLTDRMLARA